jgi:hypothetical protein
MIGKPDTAKRIIINAFVFLCLTHTLGGWLNNEPRNRVQLVPKRLRGKIVHQVYRVKEPGMDHRDIPTLEKCIEQRNFNPTF